MSDLLIADVSEFQPNIDWAAYGNEHPAVIVRAHSGGRPDKEWARNAAGAADHCRWWSAYQYLRANDDPAADARAFLALLDALPANARPDCTIVDIEEGAGDQQLRQHRWLAVMADDPARDWTYSGDYFARTHGLTVEWVAAYQQREPSVVHVLWQNTDKQTFAGIGAPCDGSIFHGTIDDLVALTGSSPAPPPQPAPVQEDDLMATLIRTPSDGKVWCLSAAGRWHIQDAAQELPLVEWNVIKGTDVTSLSAEQEPGFLLIPEIKGV